MILMDDLFSLMKSKNASDIHLAVGVMDTEFISESLPNSKRDIELTIIP